VIGELLARRRSSSSVAPGWWRVASSLCVSLVLTLLPVLYSVPVAAQPRSGSPPNSAWGNSQTGKVWGATPQTNTQNSNTWGSNARGGTIWGAGADMSMVNGGGSDFERMIGKQYDYVLCCDMEAMDNYLNYKGSNLAGMVKYTVTYYPTPGSVRRGQAVPTPIKFEELWYHAGKCYGEKRYNEIYPRPLAQGAIYFRSIGSSSICDHTLETANCGVRLLMEIYVKRSILGGVIVPIQCFENIGSCLGYYNFFVLSEATNGRGENMTLHLISYPRSFDMDRYYYYDDTGRR
jgi:hypothetical protein